MVFYLNEAFFEPISRHEPRPFNVNDASEGLKDSYAKTPPVDVVEH